MQSLMRRRDFLTLLGGAAATSPMLGPSASRAQQPTMPVVGFLHSASLEPNAKRLDAFRKGLQQGGFVEGQNVAIEDRWAGGQNAKLPELAARLVENAVLIIATVSSTPAPRVAKDAASTIPIFFLIAEDPVEPEEDRNRRGRVFRHPCGRRAGQRRNDRHRLL